MGDKFINRLIIATVAVLVFSWFLSWDLERTKVKKPLAPPKLVQPNSQQAAEQSVERLNKLILADKHSYDFCQDISAKNIEPVTTSYYQWIDKNGQLQVSDKKPDGVKARKITKKGRAENFRLNIVDESRVIPQKLRGKLEAGLRRIYQIYASMLPEENMKKANVTLYIFSDRDKYLAHASSLLPDTNHLSDGFYFKPKNQAVVYFRNLEQVLDVSLHEATHLINATIIGITPRWLNEGLAEYFERMRMFNQATVIEKAKYWPRLVEQSPMSLNQLGSAKNEKWKSKAQASLYANSWSLVYFLMDDNAGRDWLASYLAAVSENYCEPFDHKRWIEQNYSGGVKGLNADWHVWKQRGMGKVSHQY